MEAGPVYEINVQWNYYFNVFVRYASVTSYDGFWSVCHYFASARIS